MNQVEAEDKYDDLMTAAQDAILMYGVNDPRTEKAGAEFEAFSSNVYPGVQPKERDK